MTTTDDQIRRDPAELDTIREQCGALELALERETDPAAAAELRRELAACRQTAFELEQRDRKPEAEANGPVGDVPQVQRADTHTEAGAEVGRIEGGVPRPDYAGLYSAERIEAGELRRELAEREGQQPENSIQAGGDRERQIIHPDIAARIEEINEAHRTGVYMSGGLYGDPESIAAFEARTMPEAAQALDAGLAELAEQHEARLMERDESFSGEVVAEIEREDDGRAYVIEADGERVMVPEIEGAEMEVGDDVTVSRDPQGVYEAEAGYDYGR